MGIHICCYEVLTHLGELEVAVSVPDKQRQVIRRRYTKICMRHPTWRVHLSFNIIVRLDTPETQGLRQGHKWDMAGDFKVFWG